MKKQITNFITALLFGCAAVVPAEAENPTPYKLPSVHDAVVAEVNVAMPDALIDNVRAFSPFAGFTGVVESTDDSNSELISQLTDFASKYLGTRYRRGSAGPSAFDCSGFIGFVFKNFGYDLSRSSRTQYNEGEKVEDGDIRPGDLLFFAGRNSRSNRVGHVAMVVDVNPDGSCTFIHASTSKGVVYQKFPDGGYYSKRYIGAKRIITSEPKA